MSLGRRGFIQDTQYMQDLLNTQHYSFGLLVHPSLKRAEKKMFSSACRLPEGTLLKSKGICHHKWRNPTREEWGLAWQNICLCQHSVKWNKASPNTDPGNLTSALHHHHLPTDSWARLQSMSASPWHRWKTAKLSVSVAPWQLCLRTSHQKHVQCYKRFALPHSK